MVGIVCVLQEKDFLPRVAGRLKYFAADSQMNATNLRHFLFHPAYVIHSIICIVDLYRNI